MWTKTVAFNLKNLRLTTALVTISSGLEIKKKINLLTVKLLAQCHFASVGHTYCQTFFSVLELSTSQLTETFKNAEDLGPPFSFRSNLRHVIDSSSIFVLDTNENLI